MTIASSQYTALITSEHNQQPNFTATVAMSVQPFVDMQNLLATFPTLYDVDVAVGVQEDAVGKWVGVSRYMPVPLANVYFSWGTNNLGWGQGVWKGPYDPTAGLVRLDDESYRLVIKTKIAANHWDGTVAGAAAVLGNVFNSTITPGTLLVVDDHQDLTMTVALSGQQPPTVYVAFLNNGLFPLKPGGISVSYVITSVNLAPVFGWGVDNSFVGGWGHGAWPIPTANYA